MSSRAEYFRYENILVKSPLVKHSMGQRNGKVSMQGEERFLKIKKERKPKSLWVPFDDSRFVFTDFLEEKISKQDGAVLFDLEVADNGKVTFWEI